MDMRPLGPYTVSVVGLGCNNFGGRIDAARTDAVVGAALDAGINFFDTADIYGNSLSEGLLSRALGSRRDEVVIATKFGYLDGAAPETAKRAAEASLKRLGMDHIDLYYLHKPDPSVPIADTLGALDELVQQGAVREIACSNLSPEQLHEAEAAASGARFIALQNEYSLLHRAPEEGTLEACGELGLGFVPYFPLASGLLTGKYRRGQPVPAGTRLADREIDEAKLDTAERLIAFAEERGHTILELAFSWLLMQPTITSVIAGATRPEQVQANVAATGWTLSSEELAEIDRITGS
ncbi:MAG: aldo/keto reductase [Trueperaceae bacterium]|nr:MAG: aldo/keto reductase [Trueperaceae bacterium]